MVFHGHSGLLWPQQSILYVEPSLLGQKGGSFASTALSQVGEGEKRQLCFDRVVHFLFVTKKAMETSGHAGADSEQSAHCALRSNSMTPKPPTMRRALLRPFCASSALQTLTTLCVLPKRQWRIQVACQRPPHSLLSGRISHPKPPTRSGSLPHHSAPRLHSRQTSARPLKCWHCTAVARITDPW